jgi:hypothetical protein
MNEDYIILHRRKIRLKQPNCHTCPLDYCCHSVKTLCPLQRLVDILPELEKIVEKKEAE